ncbi:MAG: hypothetical protein PWQ20_1431 [Thermotogaceae bacterium]|nr:hypothetical protein [Thermotogaceae bacterium]
MKILVIGYIHPKYDKRVFRTVEMLSERFEVIYQYRTEKDEKEYVEGNVKYVPIKYEKNPKKKYILEYLSRKAFDRVVFDLIRNTEYNIVYFHHFLASLPIEAFKVAKKRGKVVIYDIHEYHPENFMYALTGVLKHLKEKVMWNIFEKQLRLSDKLIFVSKETQEDVFKRLSINKPYLVFPNYANGVFFSQNKEKKICIVGKTPRGITYEKEILKRLIDKGFKLKLIGMDSDVLADIPHEYKAFMPYDEMMKELSKCAFSLISYGTSQYENFKNFIYSRPNKYYDSLAAGVPVIVKNTFVSMAKEVEKYGIGVVINPKNVDESVDKILKAYENYDRLIENLKKHQEKFVFDRAKKEEFLKFILS